MKMNGRRDVIISSSIIHKVRKRSEGIKRKREKKFNVRKGNEIIFAFYINSAITILPATNSQNNFYLGKQLQFFKSTFNLF